MTKNLKLSLGICLLLIGVYLINSKNQQKFITKSLNLIKIQPNEINRFIIQNKQNMIEISRQDTGWTISGNDSLIVKDRSIDNFLNKVLNVKKNTLVTTQKGKWDTYSIDDSSGTHLALIDKNGDTREYFVFGQSKTDYSRNYVRDDKSDNVYLTNESVIFYLRANDTYWGEKPKNIVPQDSTITVK